MCNQTVHRDDVNDVVGGTAQFYRTSNLMSWRHVERVVISIPANQITDKKELQSNGSIREIGFQSIAAR